MNAPLYPTPHRNRFLNPVTQNRERLERDRKRVKGRDAYVRCSI